MWSEVVIPLLLILSDRTVMAQSTNFSFPSFTPQNVENLVEDGDTIYNEENSSYDLNAGIITGFEGSSCSRLVYKDAVRMVDRASGTVASFNTSFTFSFTSNTSGTSTSCGEGLVFTFAAAAMLTAVDYDNSGSEFCLIDFHHRNSSNGLFAVEFDSNKSAAGCFDTSDGHIGVDLNNTSLATFNLCGVEQRCSYFCGDKGDFTAWIEYDSEEGKLEVRFVHGSSGVARPRNATLTADKLRLGEFLDEYMYVGFSASTGQEQELHKIRSWQFSSKMLPRPPRAPSPSPLLMNSNSSVRPRLIAGIISTFVGALMLTFLYYFGVRPYWRRGSHTKKEGESKRHSEQLSALDLIDDSRAFSYRELKRMTKNFSQSQLLSSGGYGDVYKGTLPSGDLVAVKRFKPNVEQGEESFLAEATSLRQIRHRNLLCLRGWCHAKEGLLIVYEYMSNGSLDKWLHQNQSASTETLSWNSRRFILAGVAGGLAYLHEEWIQCVLHRDIKSSNVMLDAEFNAYLGDFGLARMVDHRKHDKTTLLAGTLGYMAPDMQYTGRATKESDVYAFGILVLEVVCGKPPLDPDALDPREFVLLDFVWHAHETQNLASVTDPRLTLASVEETTAMTQILKLGLLCCLPQPSERPCMRVVNQWLRASESGSLVLPALPACKPFYAYRSFTQSCLQVQPAPVATVRDNPREITPLTSSDNDSITVAAPDQ